MAANRAGQRAAASGGWPLKLATGVIVLTVLALAVGGYRSWRTQRILGQHREAWAVEEAAFNRLLEVRDRCRLAEAACAELAGTWETQRRVSGVLGVVVAGARLPLELGKLDLSTEYGYDATNPDPALRDVPFRARTLVVAGSAGGAGANDAILAYQERLEAAPEVVREAAGVSLQGVERMGDGSGADTPTRFAVRCTLRREPLRRGEGTP